MLYQMENATIVQLLVLYVQEETMYMQYQDITGILMKVMVVKFQYLNVMVVNVVHI